MIRVEIIEEPIEVDRILGQAGGKSGAVVEFQGVVRGLEGTDTITAIDYECHHEMAKVQLTRIAEDLVSRHDLDGLFIVHRTGRVAIGETSLYVRAVSKHRQAAFDATSALIVRLKEDVPIWKRAVPRER